MKRIIKTIIFLNLIIQLSSANLYSLPIDLTKSEIFIKRGFSLDWINELPKDNSWKRIPPGINGKRSVRVSELNFEGIPKRNTLSIKEYPSENYTFITSFELTKQIINNEKVLGIHLAQIGLNWAIYLNGHLVRREIHLSPDGNITSSRNYRHFIEYIYPSYLNDGLNILAFHIIGDPHFPATGFYWKGPYEIDDYKKLMDDTSETIPLILFFIYLFLGIYHLFLFMRRTKEKYNLYYGLLTLAYFLYALTRTHTIYSIISDTTILTKIEFSALFCIFPIAVLFLTHVLYNQTTRFVRWYTIFCGVLIIFTIPSPLAFMTDILRIWQFTAIVPAAYIVVMITRSFFQTVKETGKRDSTDTSPPSMLTNIIQTLSKTVIGNLLIGVNVIIFCSLFDILDAAYFSTGIAISKYGFFVFVIGVTFVLTNRFQFIHSQVENLNIDLLNKISDLNEANIQISLSQEKYKLLVEGTDDIIFSLDKNWNFIMVNQAILTHLKVKPEKVISKSIFDFMYEEENIGSISQRYIREKLEEFSRTREPIYFKAVFTSPLIGERKEMHVRLEYINIEGKDEILGKATRKVEDSLLKFFISENTNYSINNYLFSADEISYRLTRNLEKYIEPKDVSVLRVALLEIILNSIEHGNLEITFEDKTNSIMEGKYFEVIGQKQNNPRFLNRRVSINYSINPNEVVYTISDEGKGFDFKKVLNGNMEIVNKEYLSHGRGILMAKSVFDHIEYSKNGTSVVLKKIF